MGQYCCALGPTAMTVGCVTLNEALRGEPSRSEKLEISDLMDLSLTVRYACGLGCNLRVPSPVGVRVGVGVGNDGLGCLSAISFLGRVFEAARTKAP